VGRHHDQVRALGVREAGDDFRGISDFRHAFYREVSKFPCEGGIQPRLNVFPQRIGVQEDRRGRLTHAGVPDRGGNTDERYLCSITAGHGIDKRSRATAALGEIYGEQDVLDG